MDTNVKKFKYSYLGKLLCIVLALITGLSAIFLTTAEVLTVINNIVNGNDYSYYTLNTNVECSIEESIANGVNKVHLDPKGLEKHLNSQKTKACKTVYNKVVKQLNYYLDKLTNDGDDIDLEYSKTCPISNFVDVVSYSVDSGNYYKYFESYLVIAVIYFVLCFVFNRLFTFLEKKMKKTENYALAVEYMENP